MIKTKNKCKSKFKRFGNQIDQNNMYFMKEKIKDEIIINKQVEMKNFLDKLEKNPVSTKPFWSLLIKLGQKAIRMIYLL
jgi:hypothetical protein